MNLFPSPYLACKLCTLTGMNRARKHVTHPPYSIFAGNSVSAGANPPWRGLYHLVSSPVFYVCQLFSLQCNLRIELNAQDTGNGISPFGIQVAQIT